MSKKQCKLDLRIQVGWKAAIFYSFQHTSNSFFFSFYLNGCKPVEDETCNRFRNHVEHSRRRLSLHPSGLKILFLRTQHALISSIQVKILPLSCMRAVNSNKHSVNVDKQQNDLRCLVKAQIIYGGYYMPAYGYEFYLRVVNSISHE